MKTIPSKKKASFVWLLLICLVVFAGVFLVVVWGLKNQNSILKWKALLNLGKSQGLAVDIVLGSEKSGKIIDKKGGKLEIQNTALEIPSNSLLAASDVTLYPIEKMDGLPKGAEFVAGAQIDSTEEVLASPASLQIEVPQDLSGKNLRGVAYGKDGSNLHFFPVQIKGNQANFLLFHFSGYGIIAVDDPQMKLPEPSLERLSAEFVIESIMKTYQDDFFWGRRDEIPSGAKESLLTVMEEWYRDGVKPKLMAAVGKDDLLLDSGTEYMVWRQMGIALGFEQELADLNQEALDILAKAVKNGSDKAYQKCVSEKDATKAGRLLRIWALVEALDLNGKAGINQNEIQTKTQKCAQFELRIKSATHETSVCGVDETKASGVIKLKTDEALLIEGEGEINTDLYISCGSACTASPPERYKVAVPVLQLVATADEPKVGLVMAMKVSENVTYDCSVPNISIEYENFQAWGSNFYVLHEDEIISNSGIELVVKLADWEIVNKDGIYAKKVYQRTKSVLGGPITEDTVFELVHNPQ